MRIPVRAVYSRRGPREPERPPQMIGAAYADVPDELVIGAAAQAAYIRADAAGDVHAADIIGDAIQRAAADGKLTIM